MIEPQYYWQGKWASNPSASELNFYELSHPWGLGQPVWPYFADSRIERLHAMAKSRVLTQQITTTMHSGTHMDAPAHVVNNTPFLHEIPVENFFGTGVVLDIPKEKWGIVSAEDLDKASEQTPVREGDLVIVNTGWHKWYGDNFEYYAYAPGFCKDAGEWFVEKKVRGIGTDTQALDHPLGTSIGPHAMGPLLPWACEEYEAETGRKVLDDFPEWEPCHHVILSNGLFGIENVGGDIDKISGKRVTFISIPLRWVGGDGSMIRLVAITDPEQTFRVETGQ